MKFIALVAAFGLAALSIPFTSSAAAGATIVGIACLCGILARIAQADDHQQEIIKALGAQSGVAPLSEMQVKCPNTLCQAIGVRGPAACPKCGTPYA